MQWIHVPTNLGFPIDKVKNSLNPRELLKEIGIKIIRTANVIWEENLKDGKGKIKLDSGVFEETILLLLNFKRKRAQTLKNSAGAAHAGYFFITLANILSHIDYYPKRIHTTADIRLDRNKLNSLYSCLTAFIFILLRMTITAA